MAPAIRLAREGFELTRYDTDILQRSTALFRRDGNAARIFLHPDGSPLQPGERLVQPQLAATLTSIAADGVRAFYSGQIPDAIETASRASNGIVTAADLAAYHVTQSEPLSCTYRGYVFLSAPPPSSGGVTLCEILHILEGYDLRALGFYSAQTVHVMVEAMRHAYFDRNTYLGDPDFVTNPLAKLLSSDHAAAIRAHIGDRATPSSVLAPGIEPHEQTETTHYSVMDRAGNAVAVSYTLNGRFGAGVMAGDTGFFLNDEMSDFTVKRGVPNLFGLVQGEANAIAPGKRPLSSMTPTVGTARWPCVSGIGLAGRSAHHYGHPRDSVEHPGVWHGAAGSGGYAAPAPPVAARRDFGGTLRASFRHACTAPGYGLSDQGTGPVGRYRAD